MQQLASIASSQLEKLIRRISAVVLFVVGIETLVNASFQVASKDTFGLIQLAIFVLFTLLATLSLWFDLGPLWVTAHGVTVLVLTWLSISQFPNPSIFGSEGRPWIWWSIGLSAILVGVYSPRIFGILFIPGVSVSWFFVEFVIFGEDRILQALLDSAYFIVFALAVLGLVGLVRQAAGAVDEANTEAIRSSIEQAKFEAIERERQRLDALVHDQVLHTLLIAARANTEGEFKSAEQSASNAIKSLEVAALENPVSEEVTTAGLMSAIASAAAGLDSRVQVQVSSSNNLLMPSEVAQAMTEAAMQALDNAIQHSSAQSIFLRMSVDALSAVKFEISDDGVGFRPDRVSRDRIGIRTSINFRMTSIGGKAAIESRPGGGTKVLLEWRND